MTVRMVAALVAALAALASAPATAAAGPRAVNGRIVAQSLDDARTGYTVLSVWGTHYQMGFAHGALLAADVLFAVHEAKTVFAKVYPRGRQRVATMRFGLAPDGASSWLTPRAIDDELRGVVDGVKAVLPDADLTVTDLKVVNTIADWLYPPGCNSHSAWGSRVRPPVRALHSRRLDTPLLLVSRAIKHHVIVARDATDGDEPERWVNVAWAGYVLSLTGVNEHGVLASLHDRAIDMHSSPGRGLLSRLAANRLLLTAVHDVPLAEQLDFVYALLRRGPIATSGYINWFAPGGHGGVITCVAGERCSDKRVPQPEFHGGEVLITTNFDTDGKTAPQWGEYLDDFYREGGFRTLKQHFDVLKNGPAFSPPVHVLSVAYRGRGDMTLRFAGAVTNDSVMTKPLTLEFAELFGDRRTTAIDASSTASVAGATASDGGGGCAAAREPKSARGVTVLLLLLLGALATWRFASR